MSQETFIDAAEGKITHITISDTDASPHIFLRRDVPVDVEYQLAVTQGRIEVHQEAGNPIDAEAGETASGAGNTSKLSALRSSSGTAKGVVIFTVKD